MTTLVFLEHHEGKLEKDSLGVLGKAVQLGGDVSALIAGSGVEGLAAEFHGATLVSAPGILQRNLRIGFMRRGHG